MPGSAAWCSGIGLRKSKRSKESNIQQKEALVQSGGFFVVEKNVYLLRPSEEFPKVFFRDNDCSELTFGTVYNLRSFVILLG
jgi:hypothetical protein